MKKMRKYSVIFIIVIIIILTNILNKETRITSKDAAINSKYNSEVTVNSELPEIYKALQEVAYSYWMRGENIQYNSRKAHLVKTSAADKLQYFSPEEATNQNINYMTCSKFTMSVYYELLGVAIPSATAYLLEYGKNNIGRPEVIAYGCYDENDNFSMGVYKNGNFENLEEPTLANLLPYLYVGDVITYTGHTMLVYDLIYDDFGNVSDALLIHCSHGPKSQSYYIQSKIEAKSNHKLYHNPGSLNFIKISERSQWNNIGEVEEYSVLRFIQQDDEGKNFLSYIGNDEAKNIDYNEYNYDETKTITIGDKNYSRLNYSRLYIEKTVDKYADDIVQTNEELTYRILVKNNSNIDYDKDIKVVENISDYVTYKTYTANKENISFKETISDNKKIEWNIGKLNSGEEVIIEYKVAVKEYCYGQTITSTGTVANIPSTTVNNTIGNILTEAQVEKIKKEYTNLVDTYAGKELINQIYSNSFGVELELNEFKLCYDAESEKGLIINNEANYSGANLKLNNKDPWKGVVLNKYFGALWKNQDDNYDLKLWRGYEDKERRADTIYGENFKTGDILIYKNINDVTNKENGEYAYIYIEGEGFVGVNYGNDGIEGGTDDRNKFNAEYYSDNDLKLYTNTKETDSNKLEFANYQTLFGKDYYVILRPSLAVDIIPMELEINYSSKNTPTNQDVIVTITSNEEMWGVEGWTLSEDKKVLTKVYTKNAEEVVKVYDNAGNEKVVEIEVINIDKVKPVLEVTYSETNSTNQDVKVTITVNEEIQGVEGWTLSEDKKVLTKVYTENVEEVVKIYDVAGNEALAEIKISNIDKVAPVLEVTYSETNLTNTSVTATIIANEKLQQLEGWTISETGNILTKIYTENIEESVDVYDLAGNKSTIQIKIANIDKIEIEATVEYSTTILTNKNVTVKIIVNKEIKEIKEIAGWTLLEDKKTLIKEYSENSIEDVKLQDLVGNERKIRISVQNIDKIAPEVNVEYSELKQTNKSLTVTITANEEVQELKGWTLGEKRNILTKVYTKNTTENLEIYDLAGNKDNVKITISNIDTTLPEVKVEYSTTEKTTGNVVVTIVSNEPMQEVAGWTISEDKKCLTKKYEKNIEESIKIYDIAGNEVEVQISVKNIYKETIQKPQVDDMEESEKTDTAPTIIPNAGTNTFWRITIAIIIISIVLCTKNRKYKDIK